MIYVVDDGTYDAGIVALVTLDTVVEEEGLIWCVGIPILVKIDGINRGRRYLNHLY